MSRKPLLSDIPGFEKSEDHPLIAELRALRIRHGVAGAVAIFFTGDRVGVVSTGVTDEFGDHMERLGEQILSAIDSGLFDPGEPNA